MLAEEVADAGRVSVDTVRRAALRGDLPAIRLGPGRRLMRFRPGDVQAWLDGELKLSNAVEGSTEPAA